MHVLGRRRRLLGLSRVTFSSIRCCVGGLTYRRSHRDSYEYSHLLEQCRCIKSTKRVHAQILIGGYDQNPYLAAKLVGKYTEFSTSKMEDARKVFDFLWERDVFLWNVVIQGYANMGPSMEALNIYSEMRNSGVLANRYTFPFVLKACGSVKDGNKGRVVHTHIVKIGFEFDVFVGNALVAFYAKCQEIETSRKVFDEIPRKDLVSWNSMISGYTTNAHPNEALTLFRAMLQDVNSCGPDSATLVSILPACVQAAAIREGLWIHTHIVKSHMEIDAALGSGLIAMYGNCGRLNSAQSIFNQVPNKNIVVWNAIIRCYGMHGHADEALHLFSRMMDTGLRPDGLIFLCLLSACSHAGLVSKGWDLFQKMGEYGIERSHEHYACMVDLLGRAGFLDEAVEFIESMPFPAGKDVFGALLGACRIHNNIELAEQVAEKLFVLDPDNAGRYVILAKMHADAGRQADVARLRKVVREKKIKKQPGCSSIEVDCVLHVFGVEDESHPYTEEIFDMLETLDNEMKGELVII